MSHITRPGCARGGGRWAIIDCSIFLRPTPTRVRKDVPSPTDTRLDAEQAYVAGVYRRLDELRSRTQQRLEEVRRAGANGTHQNRSERDAFATLYEDRLALLNSVDR